MPIALTESMTSALDAEGTPLRIVDPRTNDAYVLISESVFDRMRSCLLGDGDVGDKAVAALIHENMAEEDAGDPLLASYQTPGT